MTKADKEFLLYLVTRPSTCIHPLEAASAVNYIHGYEWGTQNKCDFTELVRCLLADKYKISYSSDGWPGQIKRLAKRRHSTWLIIFRKITLEIIVNDEGGSLDETQQAFLKGAVMGRIERLMEIGTVGFGESWIDDWLSSCAVKSSWFKQLWSRKEWTIIRAIDKLVQVEGVFRGELLRDSPSPALLQLKTAYADAVRQEAAFRKS